MVSVPYARRAQGKGGNVTASQFVLRRPATPAALRGIAWSALAAIIFFAGDALFSDTFFRLIRAFREPEFSHGYLIPLISAWIIWQRRRMIWSRRTGGAWSGWFLTAVGAVLALLFHAVNLLMPPYLAFLLIVFGLSSAALGSASARYLITPLILMLFAYPLPDYINIEVSTSLQLISSYLGATILDIVGVPVFLEGNIIDLGAIKLQVAEACSGLRYLLPLVSFGVLCAFIYRAPWWAKLVIVAATVPLTIFLNGLRIAMTGLFVHFGSPSLADGFMHLFEGWVVFLVALAALFGAMYGLLRLTGWSGAFIEMLDFDRMAGAPGGVEPPPRMPAPAPIRVPPPPLIAGAATLVLAAMLLIPLGERSTVIPDRIGLLHFPMALGDRIAKPQFLAAETEQLLGADDYLLLDYLHEDAPPINLWVAYYDSLINGSYVHSPTTCLPGAGWEYVTFGKYNTAIRDLSGDMLRVNRGEIVKGRQRILMYFWMELRGRSVPRLQHVKFLNLWDSMITGRSDGALIRIYTPLRPGEETSRGDERILEFLERAYPHLRPHIGE